MPQDALTGGRWTFLTNHAHVLLCLAQSPELRLRDVAAVVGITERAVQRIVADLEDAGYLTRKRTGRNNEYEIDTSRPLRHPIEAHQTVRMLIDLVATRGRHGERGLLQARVARAPAHTAARR